MRIDTVRAMVDIIVAENTDIIILEDEYWNESLDSKWLETRYKDRHKEINYNIKENKIFLDKYKDEGDDILYEFIIDINGTLRLGIDKRHNTLTEFPFCVIGAGRMIVGESGNIKYIDNHSGHYKPTKDEFLKSLKYFEKHTITNQYVWEDLSVLNKKLDLN